MQGSDTPNIVVLFRKLCNISMPFGKRCDRIVLDSQSLTFLQQKHIFKDRITMNVVNGREFIIQVSDGCGAQHHSKSYTPPTINFQIRHQWPQYSKTLLKRKNLKILLIPRLI